MTKVTIQFLFPFLEYWVTNDQWLVWPKQIDILVGDILVGDIFVGDILVGVIFVEDILVGDILIVTA